MTDIEKTQIEAQILLIKNLRRGIDAHIQMVKDLPQSLECITATLKLKEAVMWLGMDLKRIGEENPGFAANPYPHSKDPSNTVIDKTADGLKL